MMKFFGDGNLIENVEYKSFGCDGLAFIGCSERNAWFLMAKKF